MLKVDLYARGPKGLESRGERELSPRGVNQLYEELRGLGLDPILTQAPGQFRLTLTFRRTLSPTADKLLKGGAL